MLRKSRYEKFHEKLNLQKKIISNKNFTYKNLLEFFDKYRGKKILDVGSGSGVIAFYLASKNNKVLGIDISSRAVTVAQKNAFCLGLGEKVKFQICDFPNGGIKDKFDLILLNDVLEHIPNDSRAMAKAESLLNKNGSIFISAPLKDAPLNRYKLLEKFDKKVGHIRRYNFKDLSKLIYQNKLKIISYSYGEGVLRNSLFVYKFLNFFVKLANRFNFISWLFSFLDGIAIFLFGPSSIYLTIRKQ